MRTLAAALALVTALPAAGDDAVIYKLRPAVDIPVIVGGFAVAGVPYLLGDHVLPHRCPCDPAEVNRFDRFAIDHASGGAATLSDVTVGIAVAAPPIVDALRLGFGEAFTADAVVYAQTLAVNSALVVVAKYAFQRPRPRTYAGDPAFLTTDDGYQSFYSGHTSTVVAALTAAAWTARWRHGEQVWPWVVVGLGGASVGAERVLAGRHFPTDVIAGAVMGFAVGTVVPWLHRKHDDPAVAVSPLPYGISVSGRF